MLLRQIAFVLLMSAALVAQSPNPQADAGSSATNAMTGPQAPSAPPSDRRSQILDDLNKMDSLNLNMSSEIEFLRDQNLQILLRTNAQMWTILIRDLRRQVEQDDQRRMASPPQPQAPPAKPNPR
jgi:hypothetical protein